MSESNRNKSNRIAFRLNIYKSNRIFHFDWFLLDLNRSKKRDFSIQINSIKIEVKSSLSKTTFNKGKLKFCSIFYIKIMSLHDKKWFFSLLYEKSQNLCSFVWETQYLYFLPTLTDFSYLAGDNLEKHVFKICQYD